MVELTELGQSNAEHITNHHFILERFLKDSLEVSNEFAHQEALKLSNVISCELIDKICEKYNYKTDDLNFSFCEQRKYELR